MEHFERAGLTFDVRDAGPADGEVVILLHGFPQGAQAWDAVTPALNAAGYRTLAPDQRGYAPGARPAGTRSYAVDELVADVLTLARAAGTDRFHVVGHDWGAVVAWATAAEAPAEVRTLTALSVPHPRAMLASMLRSTQALRSTYMLFFQLPWLPERALLARGGRQLVRQMVREGVPEATARGYLARLAEPGAATGALNWYRALRHGGRDVAAVEVPTLFVWSTGDHYLGRTGADLTRHWVTGPYRFEALTGVSHWIPEAAPGVLSAMLLDHLQHRAG